MLMVKVKKERLVSIILVVIIVFTTIAAIKLKNSKSKIIQPGSNVKNQIKATDLPQNSGLHGAKYNDVFKDK